MESEQTNNSLTLLRKVKLLRWFYSIEWYCEGPWQVDVVAADEDGTSFDVSSSDSQGVEGQVYILDDNEDSDGNPLLYAEPGSYTHQEILQWLFVANTFDYARLLKFAAERARTFKPTEDYQKRFDKWLNA